MIATNYVCFIAAFGINAKIQASNEGFPAHDPKFVAKIIIRFEAPKSGPARPNRTKLRIHNRIRLIISKFLLRSQLHLLAVFYAFTASLCVRLDGVATARVV